METTFKNLIELTKNFSDEETCWNHLEALRWLVGLFALFVMA